MFGVCVQRRSKHNLDLVWVSSYQGLRLLVRAGEKQVCRSGMIINRWRWWWRASEYNHLVMIHEFLNSSCVDSSHTDKYLSDVETLCGPSYMHATNGTKTERPGCVNPR